MKIATIIISPKKGESVTLRFHVLQSVPFPDITSNGSGLEWRNFGGLFSHYGKDAAGIGEGYLCYLLADNVTEPTGTSRVEHAGYNGNGGSFTLRGKDIGELRIEFCHSPHLGCYPDIKVRGFESPTPSEREFIESQIVAPLRAFIAAERDALKAEAVEKITTGMHARIATARKEIDRLESQIATAKF